MTRISRPAPSCKTKQRPLFSPTAAIDFPPTRPAPPPDGNGDEPDADEVVVPLPPRRPGSGSPALARIAATATKLADDLEKDPAAVVRPIVPRLGKLAQLCVDVTEAVLQATKPRSKPRRLPPLRIVVKKANRIHRVVELDDPRDEWCREFNNRTGRVHGIHAIPFRETGAIAIWEVTTDAGDVIKRTLDATEAQRFLQGFLRAYPGGADVRQRRAIVEAVPAVSQPAEGGAA